MFLSFWRRLVLLALVLASGVALGKPDMVVTDVWVENGVLQFHLLNQGESVAKAGFSTALMLEGKEKDRVKVSDTFQPGDRKTLAFKMSWKCGGESDELMVIADCDDELIEQDETNNALHEVWVCDAAPPHFIQGPDIIEVTPTSALVRWKTDEPVMSRLCFDHRAGMFEEEIVATKLKTDHSVTLTGLAPYTTYHVQVEVEDAAGNESDSPVDCFATKAPADSQKPKIRALDLTNERLPWFFNVDARDDSVVDRVTFSLDGDLIQTDHAAPYEFFVDTLDTELNLEDFIGPHLVGAEVFDGANHYSAEDVVYYYTHPCELDSFDFVAPADRQELLIDGDAVPVGADPIDIVVYAHGLPISGQVTEPGGGVVNRNENVDLIEVYVNGELHDSATRTTQLITQWDPSETPVGEVPFTVKVYDGFECSPATQTHPLRIIKRYPDLRLRSRTVEPNGIGFTVTLDLKNEGTGSLELVSIQDSLRGFQVVTNDGALYPATGQYDPDARICDVEIDANTILSRGESITLSYDIMPVLHPVDINYSVGPDDLRVDYRFGEEEFTKSGDLAHEGHFFNLIVNFAIQDSDYLIVTDPRALLLQYEEASVQALLNTLTEFAEFRQGVLAYFDGRVTLRDIYPPSAPITVGHMINDGWLDQLIVCNRSREKLSVVDLRDSVDLFDLPDVGHGDPIAAGNVFAGTLTSNHRCDEVLVADGLDGTVRVFQYFAADESVEVETLDTEFEYYDPFLVGNVIPEDWIPQDELIMAHRDGTVKVYHDGLAEMLSFHSAYTVGDAVLAANLLGDFQLEIVIVDRSAHRLEVHAGDGTLLESLDLPGTSPLAGSWQVAAGDCQGGYSDELVVLYPDLSELRIFEYASFAEEIRLVDTLSFPADSFDVLMMGSLHGGAKDAIMVAHRTRSNHNNMWDVDLFFYKDGLPMRDRHFLDHLINPGGDWARRLAEGWCDDGFLLLVGEDNIIPAFSNAYELGTVVDYVDYTDSFYGNTCDDPKEPEISVGRIIGNTPDALADRLRHTMAVARGEYTFTKTEALVAASEDAESERRHFRDELEEEGYFVVQLQNPSIADLMAGIVNKDVIVTVGHGYAVCNPSDVDDHFRPGHMAPLVYANGCDEGSYVPVPCLPGAYLTNGACAFIGSTAYAISPWLEYLCEGFFDRFAVGATVGQALKNAKIDRMGSNAYAKFTSNAFHLFGDPKLQFQDVGKTESMPAGDNVLKGPVSSVHVVIPDPVIRKTSPFDDVSLPGGTRWLVTGKPVVPCYPVRIVFPPGYQVQGVQLQKRSDVSLLGRLNLEPVIPSATQLPPQSPAELPHEGPDPVWWPGSDFNWRTRLEVDGSTTLLLDVLPLQYHPQTLETQLHQCFDFEIDIIKSCLVLKSFASDRRVVGLGEPLVTELAFENTGEVGDFRVEIRISSMDGSFSEGFPLATLRQARALNTYSSAIPTQGLEPGHYRIRCLVRDLEGAVHLRATDDVTLGRTRGFISSLSVNPEPFKQGEPVTLNASFTNSGDTDLEGTLVIEVWDTQHDEKVSFVTDFQNLGPSNHCSLTESWQATTDPDFVIVSSFARFAGMASEVRTYHPASQ